MKRFRACLVALAAFLPRPALAQHAAQAVRIVEKRTSGRPFAWQSTRETKDFAFTSGKAVADGKAGDVMVGSFGVLASVPLAVVAAPYDLIAAPFRRMTTVRFVLRAKVVDGSGAPAKDMPVSAESVGAYGSGRYEAFHNSYIGRTDADGNLNMEAEGSFGANNRFVFEISTINPAAPIDAVIFTKKSKEIKIDSDPAPSRWRIIPAEAPPGSPKAS